MEHPFAKHISSVFVVCSPFQALCAISAIRNLEISDYKFIVVLSGYKRDDQLLSFVKRNKIDFEVFKNKRFSYWIQFVKALKKCNKGYRRLFIGDFRTYLLYWVGLQKVRDNADIIILDDGNITISLLKDSARNRDKWMQQICMDVISNIRKVRLLKNLFTIYDKIDNPKYNIAVNKLSVLHETFDSNTSDKVYFIGTKKVQYCRNCGWETDEYFISALDSILCSLKEKYCYADIVYVPHGDDVGEYAERLCEKYNIMFTRPNEMVELFILINGSPIAVYGFTSSALYNIKKMFPNSNVYNIVFSNVGNEQAKIENIQISEYYKENDIQKIVI